MKNLKSLQEGQEQNSSSKKLAQYMKSKVQNLMYDLDEVVKELIGEGQDVNSIAYALMEMGYEQDEVQEIFESISKQGQPEEEDIYEDVYEQPSEEVAEEDEMQMAMHGKEKKDSFKDWYNKSKRLPKAQMMGQFSTRRYPPRIGETVSEYASRLKGNMAQPSDLNNFKVWDGTKFVEYGDFNSPSTQVKSKGLYNAFAEEMYQTAQDLQPEGFYQMTSEDQPDLSTVTQMGEQDEEIKLADDPNAINVGDEDWYYEANREDYKEIEQPKNWATPIVNKLNALNSFLDTSNIEKRNYEYNQSMADQFSLGNTFAGKTDVNTGKNFSGLLSPFIGGSGNFYAQNGTERQGGIKIPIKHTFKSKAQEDRINRFLEKNPEYREFWEYQNPSVFDLNEAEKTYLDGYFGDEYYDYRGMPIKGTEQSLPGNVIKGNAIGRLKRTADPYIKNWGSKDYVFESDRITPLQAYSYGLNPSGYDPDFFEMIEKADVLRKLNLDPQDYIYRQDGRFMYRPLFPGDIPTNYGKDVYDKNYQYGDPVYESGDLRQDYIRYYNEKGQRIVPDREKMNMQENAYSKNKKLYLADKITKGEFIKNMEAVGFEGAESIVPYKDTKKKKLGGHIKRKGGSTGDQSNYGLVTGESSDITTTNDIKTKNTLTEVPKEQANLEAEGGETALVDLNNDGNFALYEIKGKRHSQGGTFLNLPDQSFIFSDFNKMKLTKDEMAEMGIETKKRMTPAKASLKYPTNEYYAAMKDPYVDDIQGNSAKLMLDKNKNKLSQLAFIQERKKDFEDGVPLTAFPYIQSQGQDPVEFMQQVENLNEQQAQQRLISQLPQEQQMQIAMLQEYMQQVDQDQQMQEEQMEMMPPPGMSDQQLAQMGFEIDTIPTESYSVDYDMPFMQTAGEMSVLERLGISPSRTNIPIMDRPGPGEQPRVAGTALFDKALQNLPGFFQSWKGIYDDEKLKKLQAALQTPGDKAGKLKEVGEFQNWYDKEYLPKVALQFAAESIGEAEGLLPDEFSTMDMTRIDVQELAEDILAEMRSKYSFTTDPSVGSRQFDFLMGDFTSGLTPFERQSMSLPMVEVKPEKPKDPPKAEEPEDKTQTQEEEDDVVDTISPGKLEGYANLTNPAFWLQDLIKINAAANRKRKKFYPYQSPVENVELNWLLRDPTRDIAAVNEQLNIMGEAVGAFAGPQSLSARMANAQGKAAANIANVISNVHNKNIDVTNKGLAMQAQYDQYLNAARRKRTKELYDDTMKVEQRYLDEKNFDREQLADLVANAYTNAANTYNLNTLYDYYNIDPSTGGFINMVDSRIFDKNKRPTKDPIQRRAEIAAEYKKKTGFDPTQETIENIMNEMGYGDEDPLERARKQYESTNPMDIDTRGRKDWNPRARRGNSAYKKGGSTSNKLLPFFIGTIGI